MSRVSPILSILIPAYNYKKGVIGILNQISSASPILSSQVEILISDDSDMPLFDNEEVEAFRHNLPLLYYKYNDLRLGAANNWNYLLTNASSSYVWFIHHDDVLCCNPRTWELLLHVLSTSSIPVFLVSVKKKVAVRILTHTILYTCIHTAPILIVRLFSLLPYSFFFANPIGCPSSLIVHKRYTSLFDTRLCWLIDCNWYYKIFSDITFDQIALLPPTSIQLLSDSTYKGSITNTIRATIRQIRIRELAAIQMRSKLLLPSFLLSVLARSVMFLRSLASFKHLEFHR